VPTTPNIPSYRLHKPSGQAVVTIDGRDHYLGPHNTPQSRQAYDRTVGEWLSHGRAMPTPERGESLTVWQLFDLYRRHAESYYRRPDGSPTCMVGNVNRTLNRAASLYGDTDAASFGPIALSTCIDKMIRDGLGRSTCNHEIKILKQAFRWATTKELIPPSVTHGLSAVSGLRRGRSGAREPRKVLPVPDDAITAVQPYVSDPVWALIQLQLATAARPGELVALRPVDIDRSGEVWTAAPADHKTAHHGHERRVYFGPRAQAALAPLLIGRADNAYLFSPAEAVERWLADKHAARKTPLSCGNRPGSNRSPNPKRPPGEHYTVDSYRRAIARGCDRAFPHPSLDGRSAENLNPRKLNELLTWQREHRWTPHRLRHNAATRLRQAFGIETARAVLGHRAPSTTEIYAELDHERVRDAIARAG
jgi:integrase